MSRFLNVRELYFGLIDLVNFERVIFYLNIK